MIEPTDDGRPASCAAEKLRTRRGKWFVVDSCAGHVDDQLVGVKRPSRSRLLGTFLEWVMTDRCGPAFMFLATTGCRRAEALGLTWDDVDLDNGTVSIRRARIAIDHTATTGASKTGRSWENALDLMTVGVLRQQRARQAEERLQIGAGYATDSLVFTLPDGRGFHPERFSASSIGSRPPTIGCP